MIEAVYILDRSGSMGDAVDDTIGGYNEMLGKLDPDDRVTTVLFDNQYEVLGDNVPMHRALVLNKENYFVRGTTALIDAICRTIDSVGKRLSETPDDQKPEKVAVVIITDGFENASREFTSDDARKRITHQREKYGWEISFIGTEEKSINQAVALGVPAASTMQYNKMSTRAVYNTVVQKVNSLKHGGNMTYDATDRSKAMGDQK